MGQWTALDVVYTERYTPYYHKGVIKMNKWKRIFAFAIDSVICAVIQVILMIVFHIDPLAIPTDIYSSLFIEQLIIILICTTYFLCRDVIGKESIGKKIMKLKIVNQNGDDKNVSFGRRILRNIPLFLGIIEVIMFLANKGRRIGDVIARTSVQTK